MNKKQGEPVEQKLTKKKRRANTHSGASSRSSSKLIFPLSLCTSTQSTTMGEVLLPAAILQPQSLQSIFYLLVCWCLSFFLFHLSLSFDLWAVLGLVQEEKRVEEKKQAAVGEAGNGGDGGKVEKKEEEKKPDKNQNQSQAEDHKKEDEKAAGSGDDAKDAKEQAPPPPPQDIVLGVYMHCEGCARKVRRSLKGFSGGLGWVQFDFS